MNSQLGRIEVHRLPEIDVTVRVGGISILQGRYDRNTDEVEVNGRRIRHIGRKVSCLVVLCGIVKGGMKACTERF